jgi:hypothetical protein
MAAKEIIEEYSNNNTLEELDDELGVILKQDQELGEFLASCKLAGFGEHPRYEEMKVAMLLKVASAQPDGVGGELATECPERAPL